MYNGIEDYPDEEILRLSDSFEEAGEYLGFGKEDPSLELVAKVININVGRNVDKVEKCPTLAGYSIFVGKVREYERVSGNLEEGINLAIKYCREHGILKDTLEKNELEVKRMLITEWNWDDAREVWREEGKEEREKEIARNALAEGLPLETIQTITGLDIKTIKSLAAEQC